VEVTVMLSSASASATAATVHPAHPASLEEHLENVVRVHSSHPASSSLIDFVNVGPFVVHLALFLVWKYTIRFSNVLELGLGSLLFLLCALTMFIRMPLDSHLSVSLLYICLTGTLVDF
jgi:hypothetical protein